MRTWNQCLKEYNNAHKIIYQGKDVRLFKPVCFTVEEYKHFKSEGRDVDSIGDCESGVNMHNKMRDKNIVDKGMEKNGESTNEIVGYTHIHVATYRLLDHIGIYTPREGYYKVLRHEGNFLICYYNCKRGDVFLEEEVKITRSNFYNKSSVGPNEEISEGDVINVKDSELITRMYDDESYQTYKIVWNFYNHRKKTYDYDDSYDDDYYDDRPSYDKYGGYNDWDDDTIDSAFEGDPEATWNID